MCSSADVISFWVDNAARSIIKGLRCALGKSDSLEKISVMFYGDIRNRRRL